MAKVEKTRLCIIFGGKSGEHEVSINSAASVISALDHEEYEISVVGITKTGRLAGSDEVRKMLPAQAMSRVEARPCLEGLSSGMLLTQGVSRETAFEHQAPEIVFPLLHGPYGEDGTIQGLLEIVGVPYVGCGVLASAVGMDKDFMKRLFLQSGLPVPPFKTFLAKEAVKDLKALKKSLSQDLGYPMFSKPANLGSSVGVCKIRSGEEFEEAFLRSAQYDSKVLIEKGIDAREIECAILGNDQAQASVPGEILPAHDYYDYEAKYVSSDSRLEIPARIEDGKAKEIQSLALQAFKAIDGAGLARVDFFLERKTDKIWINEINTMPGFTPISMYSKLWAASGVAFEELVRRLVRLGKERCRERNERRVSAN